MQNVPAITLYQITVQPDGNRDVFLPRRCIKSSINIFTLLADKSTWKTQ
jgi:hypothetical protein